MTSVGTEWKRAGQIQQELSCFSVFFSKSLYWDRTSVCFKSAKRRMDLYKVQG